MTRDLRMLSLTTRRLRLVALDRKLARAALHDRDAFRHAVRALVPEDWPADPVRELLADLADDAADPDGWGPWVLVDASARVVIGDAGFKGPPGPDGTVQVGYGIIPSYRGRGMATEALHALTQRALAEPGVRDVRAETVTNPASERVLEKAGFERTGHEGDTTFWSLTTSPAPRAETP